MKFSKIFIFILCLLCLTSISYSALVTDNEGYYKFDIDSTSQIDSTGNGNTVPVFGATFTSSGKINGGYVFDGSNDYMTSPISINTLTTARSYSLWFKTSTLQGGIAGLVVDRSGSPGGLSLLDGKIFANIADGSFTTTGTFTDNTWYHVVLTYDGSSESKLYIDNSLIQTFSAGSLNEDHTLTLGSRSSSSGFFNGNIDEIGVWLRALNTTEVSELYNNGLGLQYPYTITIPFINNDVQQYYNTTNISIQLNTTSNVNMSYILDLGSEISICNNCNNTILNLTSLTELSHNITFISENNDGRVNVTENFIVDLTPPLIELIGNLTQEVFEINFSTIVNVTDSLSGLASCTINLTYLENVTNPEQFGSFINCTDTQTFIAPGLYSGFLFAVDNAGNANSTIANGTITPLVQIKFNNTVNGSLVDNYNVTIVHPDGRIEQKSDINGSIFISPVEDGILDLGIHNITFIKLGFASDTFNLNVSNETAGTTQIFNVTTSKIILKIFDRDSKQLLTGNSDVTLIASTGFSGNTTTGLLNISNINFISEQYQIIVTHDGYLTETIYFTYNNQEALLKEVYMLNETSIHEGTINIQVETEDSEFVQGAICIAAEWDSNISGFRDVAEGLTNINGLTILNIELDIKSYRFTCSKSGITSSSESQIIKIDASTLPIILPISIGVRPDNIFGGISGNLTNTSFNSTYDMVVYNWFDEFNLDNTGKLTVYKITGTTKEIIGTAKTSTSNPGELYVLVNTNETFEVQVVGSILDSGGGEVIIDTITYLPSLDISFSLSKYSFDLLIPILFIIIGMSIGLMLKPQNIYISAISVIVMVWLSVRIVPSVISTSIAIFVTAICGLMVWFGGKR